VKTTWPLCDVVYIFERTGSHGGALWWLVLSCGHSVSRKRYVSNHWTAQVQVLMNTSLSKQSAPKRCRCHMCGIGLSPCDPNIMIDAFSRSEKP